MYALYVCVCVFNITLYFSMNVKGRKECKAIEKGKRTHSATIIQVRCRQQKNDDDDFVDGEKQKKTCQQANFV